MIRRVVTIIILAIASIVAVNAKTYVIACGITTYHKQPRLNYSAQDATEFAKQMKKAGCQVTLLTSKNVTQANVLAALKRVAKKATPNDRVVFFFSGHGANGFALLYDGPKEKNPYLSYNKLLEKLDGINAGQKLLLLHSCHSGSASSNLIDKSGRWEDNAASRKNMVVMMSSQPGEVSIEANWTSGGWFCRALQNALHGLCDSDGDRKITYKEMGRYIFNDVSKRSNGRQHPLIIYSPGMTEAVFMKY